MIKSEVVVTVIYGIIIMFHKTDLGNQLNFGHSSLNGLQKGRHPFCQRSHKSTIAASNYIPNTITYKLSNRFISAKPQIIKCSVSVEIQLNDLLSLYLSTRLVHEHSSSPKFRIFILIQLFTLIWRKVTLINFTQM